MKARAEIGGTPHNAKRAYAHRSPMAYARRIARSGVPVQLWWSQWTASSIRATSRSRSRARCATFVPALRSAPSSVTGRFRDDAACSMLIPALKEFNLFPTRGTTGVRAAPLHRLLPWHDAVRDAQGRLLAWYRPNAGLGYDRVLRLGWNFIERRSRNLSLRYAVFDGASLRGIYWQHNPAFLNAAFVDSALAWYPYSGDRRALAAVKAMLDYQLGHGTTPSGWAWPRVPFATSCAGDHSYGRCLAGLPRRFYGGIEPDKVGLLGRAYLLFYEQTGDRRYLRAALQAADALARHVRAGDATHSPWPFRVNARNGRVLDGAQYGGAVVGPVRCSTI